MGSLVEGNYLAVNQALFVCPGDTLSFRLTKLFVPYINIIVYLTEPKTKKVTAAKTASNLYQICTKHQKQRPTREPVPSTRSGRNSHSSSKAGKTVPVREEATVYLRLATHPENLVS